MKALTPQILGMYIGQKVRFAKDHSYELTAENLHRTLRTYSHEPGIGRLLILRRLSDMTEEEYVEWFHFFYPDNTATTTVVKTPRGTQVYVQYEHGMRSIVVPSEGFKEYPPKVFMWLLSRGFDLFNLIDSGLAVDNNQHPTK